MRSDQRKNTATILTSTRSFVNAAVLELQHYNPLAFVDNRRLLPARLSNHFSDAE
jgi:hypothetical protein